MTLPMTSQTTNPAQNAPTAPERTKTRLLELVKRYGAQTAQELAARLEVSIPAARRHIGDLLEQGLIEGRTERPGGRGRPQQVYALTERGEATFTKTYSVLCVDVLRHLERLFGEGAVLQVLQARSAEVAQRLQADLPPHLPLSERLETLIQRLNEMGFHAEAEYDPQANAWFVVQRNCPNLTVARQYMQLCITEMNMYAEVLGVKVTRETRIACGQGACRYRLHLA